jgi:hypothetical protein
MRPLEVTRQSACRLTCVASSLRIEMKPKMLDDAKAEAFALERMTVEEGGQHQSGELLTRLVFRWF